MEFPDTHVECTLNPARSITRVSLFKESDAYVTVLTGRGPRCECFCRVVPHKAQHLKDLEQFLAVMRARCTSSQVGSVSEEVLRRVLKVHLEYSNTGLETPASNGRGESSVRTMKEMVQRQKDAVFSLAIEFSIKHPLFALLMRHSEWILNHLVRNDFLVDLDNRVIKTSPYESHTGNPAPRSTSLLNRILVGRLDDDDKQPRFQTAWFLGLIDFSGEVIALHPDGVQRRHGEWRVSPMDDPESKLRELKSALALMTEVDWRTPGCKTCQVCDITKVGTLRDAENEFFLRRYRTRCGLSRQLNDFWTLVQMTHVMITSQSDTKTLTTLCRWHRNPLLDLV